VLLATTAIVVVSRLNSATPDRAATEASSSTPEPIATADVRTTASSITVGSVPAALAGSIPQTGPGITEPGIVLIASPTSDGSFDVLERIRLASPVSMLTLRPAPVEVAGRQFASASGAASQVQVSAGDQSVVVPGAKVDATLGLPVAQGDQFELRYRLTDVTVRSTPSTAGRALAAIGPLTGGVDEELPVLVIVTGDAVLALSCPLLPLSEQSCGNRVQAASGVERELPWRLAVTDVQLNLPVG
jgi:hypothetical protein